jgi:hypothetical protein
MAAVSLVRLFRWRERAEAARRALRLSPWDPLHFYYGVAAYAAYVERDYEEAIRLRAAPNAK